MTKLSWKKLTKSQKLATEPWMRNKSDELAVNNGCWFDPVRAAYFVWWVERHCRLYEGEGFAGEPVILPSIADMPAEWRDIPDLYPDFYDEDGEPFDHVLDFYTSRMAWHNELLHAGEFMHWQFECHVRLYGWQRQAAPRFYSKGITQVRRFRSGNIWIPKKSGKTPSLGFNVLYLTCGDGEPGAKTFIAAKDGTQAIRVWDHAYQMMAKSPELKDACKPNLTTHRVSYLPTTSHFEPLSSSNSNTQNSKEGLNGSVVVDETHVVDRDFMHILRYAGASRPQPLQLEFSTFGSNPEGYGKERWDKGEAIVKGEIAVDNFFHASYHAPQDLTVEQFKADPERYIRMANPAIGHTVGMEELLPAGLEASASPSDFAEYCMYRLNIWQHAAHGWLAPGVWDSCGHTFTRDEHEESQFVLGLDLARKFDMVACVPTTPNKIGSVDIVDPMFWCNEVRLRELAAKYPKILDWIQQGWIRETPGNVTDLRIVKRDIRKYAEDHSIVGIVYDATYAENLIQDLLDGETGPNGEIIWPGLIIGEQAMSQGALTQTSPVADFENDLKQGLIRHDMNPVLTWQFGHATVKEDGRGHRLIQKENRKSFRTVDGCQAAVMSRWGVKDCREWEIQDLTFYDSNEVEFL